MSANTHKTVTAGCVAAAVLMYPAISGLWYARQTFHLVGERVDADSGPAARNRTLAAYSPTPDGNSIPEYYLLQTSGLACLDDCGNRSESDSPLYAYALRAPSQLNATLTSPVIPESGARGNRYRPRYCNFRWNGAICVGASARSNTRLPYFGA